MLHTVITSVGNKRLSVLRLPKSAGSARHMTWSVKGRVWLCSVNKEVVRSDYLFNLFFKLTWRFPDWRECFVTTLAEMNLELHGICLSKRVVSWHLVWKVLEVGGRSNSHLRLKDHK